MNLKSKFLIVIGLLILILISGSSWFAYNKSQNILEETLLNEGRNIVEEKAQLVDNWLKNIQRDLKIIADSEIIIGMSQGNQKSILENMLLKQKGVESYFIADKGGNNTRVSIDTVSGASENISGEDYFKEAVNTGKTVISKPFMDEKTNSLVVAMAVPILRNNMAEGIVGGNINLTYLQEIVSEMKLNGNGYGWIVENDMTVIAHPDNNYLGNMEFVKNGGEQLQKIINKMTGGESGNGTYVIDNFRKVISFAPIEFTGWSIAIETRRGDMLSPLDILKTGTYWILAISIIFGLLITYFIVGSFTNPISNINNIIKGVADGDLTAEVAVNSNRQDEVGQLYQSIAKMSSSLREMISKIIRVTDQVTTSGEKLSSSGKQVVETAEQVGMAIQDIASGAVTQSNQIEGAAGKVTAIVNQITEVDRDTDNIRVQADEVTKNIRNGNKEINNTINKINGVKNDTLKVNEIIENLGDTSREIGEIIEIISGIAAQTNLLALNAAIEAARAGEAGRGFSVVADEIRELAEESKTATERIDGLIKGIQSGVSEAVARMDQNVASVENGVQAIGKTARTFDHIEESNSSLKQLIERVNETAVKMAQNSDEVNRVFQEITSISLEAANNSEEVAASSEEQVASTEEIVTLAGHLATIAEELSLAVNKFKV